jgi:formamidopyrimidine-DNA glycosylase
VPELPEVENVRRQIAPLMVGRTVVDAQAVSHRHIIDVSRAVGDTIRASTRKGKVMVFPLAGGAELVVHLGMTGALTSAPRAAFPAGHERARLTFDDGAAVAFSDPRRFGRFMVCDPGVYPTLPMLAEIAADPGDLPADVFCARLATSKATVKGRLLDQTVVAGVGNIYADEALWRVGVHPASPACAVPAAKAAELLAVLADLLEESTGQGGTSVRSYLRPDGTAGSYQGMLLVYGRAGLPCARCSATLLSGTVAGRTAVHCPTCQPTP